MNIIGRMAAARSAAVTCSASRHAAEIGETMARYECYPLTDDPGEAQEAGESIAATVAALWEARAEIEKLREDAQRYRWLRERAYNWPHGAIYECDQEEAAALWVKGTADLDIDATVDALIEETAS